MGRPPRDRLAEPREGGGVAEVLALAEAVRPERADAEVDAEPRGAEVDELLEPVQRGAQRDRVESNARLSGPAVPRNGRASPGLSQVVDRAAQPAPAAFRARDGLVDG